MVVALDCDIDPDTRNTSTAVQNVPFSIVFFSVGLCSAKEIEDESVLKCRILSPRISSAVSGAVWNSVSMCVQQPRSTRIIERTRHMHKSIGI